MATLPDDMETEVDGIEEDRDEIAPSAIVAGDPDEFFSQSAFRVV